jgi:hypothetical protein
VRKKVSEFSPLEEERPEADGDDRKKFEYDDDRPVCVLGIKLVTENGRRRKF